MSTLTLLPPMLARRQPEHVAAFAAAARAVAGLRSQLVWLEWLCANDPDEPKLGWRWVA